MRLSEGLPRYNVGEYVLLNDDDNLYEITEKTYEYELSPFGEFEIPFVTYTGESIIEGKVFRRSFVSRDINHDETLESRKPLIDVVNKPEHYRQGKYESIDVIEDVVRDYKGFEGYLVGNILKYLYRANYKGNKKQDIEKGQFYYNKLVEGVAKNKSQEENE